MVISKSKYMAGAAGELAPVAPLLCIWEHDFMKTTLEIPDAIFRRAKTVAAERGIPFRALVSEALADKLRAQGDKDSKPWMKTFGKLHRLHRETARINRIIEEEFDQIENDDQQ